MVNVANSTDVNVGLGAIKVSCHKFVLLVIKMCKSNNWLDIRLEPGPFCLVSTDRVTRVALGLY